MQSPGAIADRGELMQDIVAVIARDLAVKTVVGRRELHEAPRRPDRRPTPTPTTRPTA